MSPRDLTRLGTLLYGPCWRSALADGLGVNRKSLSRWLDKEWPIPEGIPADMKRLMRERIAELQQEVRSL